jgi:ferredoxin--NADP+ reductase
MSSQLGTINNPLRVAIIGSGPSGFYAAGRLQEEKNLVVEIDMFDRLPTPYGLVRGGVAPDHQKIKSVTKVYDKIASKPNFHFYGNVEFGTDVTLSDLERHYHAVIYAVGAQSDRQLGIPGEDLPGSHAATEFVAWYNAHPDYRQFEFDLSQEKAVVIGLGNVAMDVIRILAQTYDELYPTDIADYALEELKHSNIKEIYVLGRRGPAQSAFTNPEIKELGELHDAEVIVSPEEIVLDPYSQAFIDSGEDKVAVKNVEILKAYSQRPPQGKSRRIIMRFLTSPVEIIGKDHVEAIRIVKNELYQTEKGEIRPRETNQYETIPVGLVFRSVGYHGVPLPGVPFYEKWGTIPNEKGRVMTTIKDGQQVIGNYVVGWIKRGPSGVIGTNKPDAVETVEMLLEDLANDKLLEPDAPNREAIEDLLNERGIQYVTFENWLKLDAIEQERGAEINRPRVKFSRVEDMLEAVGKISESLPDPAGD